MRCGLRTSSMFMPHSSGQRHGLVRNMREMAHSVSPRLDGVACRARWAPARTAARRPGRPARRWTRWRRRDGQVLGLPPGRQRGQQRAASTAAAVPGVRREAGQRPCGAPSWASSSSYRNLTNHWRFCAQALDWATFMAAGDCRQRAKVAKIATTQLRSWRRRLIPWPCFPFFATPIRACTPSPSRCRRWTPASASWSPTCSRPCTTPTASAWRPPRWTCTSG